MWELECCYILSRLLVILEAWGGALSSWNMYGLFVKYLAMTGHRFSYNTLMYFSLSIVPSMKVNNPWPWYVIQPHTITFKFLPVWRFKWPMHSGRYFSRFVLQTLTTPQPLTVTAISSLNMILLQFSATVHVNLFLAHETRRTLFICRTPNFLAIARFLKSYLWMDRWIVLFDTDTWLKVLNSLVIYIYQRWCTIPSNDSI